MKCALRPILVLAVCVALTHAPPCSAKTRTIETDATAAAAGTPRGLSPTQQAALADIFASDDDSMTLGGLATAPGLRRMPLAVARGRLGTLLRRVVDADGDGYLTVKEVAQWLKSLQQLDDSIDVEDSLDEAEDEFGDKLSFEDLLTLAAFERIDEHFKNVLKKRFDLLDSDKDGFIETSLVGLLVSNVNEKTTILDAALYLKSIGKQLDGKFSKKEFAETFFARYPAGSTTGTDKAVGVCREDDCELFDLLDADKDRGLDIDELARYFHQKAVVEMGYAAEAEAGAMIESVRHHTDGDGVVELVGNTGGGVVACDISKVLAHRPCTTLWALSSVTDFGSIIAPMWEAEDMYGMHNAHNPANDDSSASLDSTAEPRTATSTSSSGSSPAAVGAEVDTDGVPTYDDEEWFGWLFDFVTGYKGNSTDDDHGDDHDDDSGDDHDDDSGEHIDGHGGGGGAAVDGGGDRGVPDYYYHFKADGVSDDTDDDTDDDNADDTDDDTAGTGYDTAGTDTSGAHIGATATTRASTRNGKVEEL